MVPTLRRKREEWGTRGLCPVTHLANMSDAVCPQNAQPLEDRVKPSRISEGLEVTVSGDKRYSAIDTALSDERVAKTCLALLCRHLSSQAARTMLIARADGLRLALPS